MQTRRKGVYRWGAALRLAAVSCGIALFGASALADNGSPEKPSNGAILQDEVPITDAELCTRAIKTPLNAFENSVEIYAHKYGKDWPDRDGPVVAGHAFTVTRFRDPGEAEKEKVLLSGFILGGEAPEGWPTSFGPIDFLVLPADEFADPQWVWSGGGFLNISPSERDRLLFSVALFLRIGTKADDVFRALSGPQTPGVYPENAVPHNVMPSQYLDQWYICQNCKGQASAFLQGGQDLRTLQLSYVEHHLVFLARGMVLGGALLPNAANGRVRYFSCESSKK